MSLFPPPQFYYFSSSFLNSLPLHNINLSSPFIILISLLHNFIIFLPPPPPPHLFYIFFHPQIHRPPIDPTSTPHRPHIDHTLNFSDTASRIVELDATTTIFILLSLHRHHNSIVLTPPIVFLPNTGQTGQPQVKIAKIRPKRPNSGPKGQTQITFLAGKQ